jgi:hypothetical protein
MNPWPKHPFIYEINTWVWLNELKTKHNASITLANVPAGEWNSIAELGVTAVWLMGVWQRSPAGIAIANRNKSLLEDFRRALPDFRPADNVGSPYCVRRYGVDEHLGGAAGLGIARKELAQRDIRLILDFVPNHVAPDHPWIIEHPEYFVQGTAEDLAMAPTAFYKTGDNIFALGRDPYFPAWPDVVQFNAFHQGLRKAIIETVGGIADQCDGIRCDMAMLLINSIFERTWGGLAGPRPQSDYWREIIPAVKEKHPEFRFVAEAYWDLEWELQQQGFDYCYDKRLYDRLEHDSAGSVRSHLCAELGYQERLVRFIENHDEPRAAAVFGPEKHRTVAVTALTLPGARLIHEGQMEGRRVRLPVFLARRPTELTDFELQGFYQVLLTALRKGDFLHGNWRLCELTGWPDNTSYQNLVSWCWQTKESLFLIVVNLSRILSQGLVRVPLGNLRGRSWRLQEVFTAAIYERDGDEMCGPGIYVDLPPWGFHFLTWSQG